MLTADLARKIMMFLFRPTGCSTVGVLQQFLYLKSISILTKPHPNHMKVLKYGNFKMEVILKSNPNSLETSGLKNSNQMLILILVFIFQKSKQMYQS